MSIKSELGARIKKLRKKQKYTQEKFSELIDIAPRTLYGIESGKNFITAETLEKIISVLNISKEDLFVDEEKYTIESMNNFIKSGADLLNDNPDKLFYLYKMVKYLIEL